MKNLSSNIHHSSSFIVRHHSVSHSVIQSFIICHSSFIPDGASAAAGIIFEMSQVQIPSHPGMKYPVSETLHFHLKNPTYPIYLDIQLNALV